MVDLKQKLECINFRLKPLCVSPVNTKHDSLWWSNQKLARKEVGLTSQHRTLYAFISSYIYIWLHMQKHYYIPNLAFLSISYQYHIIITFNFKAQLHLKIAYIVHNTVVM